VTTVFSQMLNPGHKGDTSTNLVTPTLAARTARVFDVSAQESQVDFETDVHGIPLKGVFPVEEGTITLEPVGSELRVLVRLNINVDAVTTGNVAVDRVLRAAMATGDYPIAFYVATSHTLVPVTEEPIQFALDGELQVHNVTHEHGMAVSAQLVGGDMQAVATSIWTWPITGSNSRRLLAAPRSGSRRACGPMRSRVRARVCQSRLSLLFRIRRVEGIAICPTW